MKVTLEKKISFVVAGREFDDLKTAQFFQRAIRLHKLETESPEACAAFLIDHWNGLLFGGKNPMGFTTQQVVELVHNLQTPKVALSSPKPTPKKKKNVQVLAGDPQTKELCDALDATFALVSEPHEKLNPPEEPTQHPYW